MNQHATTDARPLTPSPANGRAGGVPTLVDYVNGAFVAKPDHERWAFRPVVEPPMDTPDPSASREAPTAPTGRDEQAASRKGEKRLLVAISAAIGAVILAPIALSSQDLYRWGAAVRGLGLAFGWPYLVPVALDLAAAACIGMTVVAAWRRDRPGIFSILVWLFAGVSAFAQWKHGIAERDAGRAQDAYWAMPAFALLGPFLLEATLHRIRRWARKDAGEQHSGAAGFGGRWLPGVAFWETFDAWRTSRREGLDLAQDSIDFVRQRKALHGLPRVEAVHYAMDALGTTDPHEVRTWLAARKVVVGQADLSAALAYREGNREAFLAPADRLPVGTDQAPPTEVPPAPSDHLPVGADPVPTGRPAAVPTESLPVGAESLPVGAESLPVGAESDPPTPRKAPTGRTSKVPARKAPTAPTGRGFAPVAVRDAAALREAFGTVREADLPGRNEIARKYDWYPGKASEARRAYLAGADLTEPSNGESR